MKRRTVVKGLVAGLATPMLAGRGMAAGIKLRVADSFPLTHQYSINTRLWLDLVTEKTGGEVTFDYFPAEQLAKSADLLDAAQNRIADIVYAPPLYQSDRLPLSTVSALPLVGNMSDPQQLNNAFSTLVRQQLNPLEIEALGVRAIRSMVTAPYQVMGREEKFESLEQLAGRKIRSSGGVQERSVKALGAVPVAIPAPDLYPALQRGTVDGTLFNIPTAMGYKLQEQVKWSSDNINLGLFPILYVVNSDVWAGLPAGVQTALEEAASEAIEPVVEHDRRRAGEFALELEAKGGGFYQVGPEQFAKWDERLSPVRSTWAEGLAAQGKPAQAILDAWTALVTV